MFRLNALYQEKTIYARCKIRIPHNTIHKVMLEFGLAKEQESKQERRKPWIRYERKHSLTAVHIDWHLSKVNGKQLCSIVDDASRKVLSAGEFDNATEENSLKIMNEAIERVHKKRGYEFEVEITQERTSLVKIAKLSCNLLLGAYKLNKNMVR